MLENEAIRILENEKPGCEEKVNFTEEEKCEAYDAAISALKKNPRLSGDGNKRRFIAMPFLRGKGRNTTNRQ